MLGLGLLIVLILIIAWHYFNRQEVVPTAPAPAPAPISKSEVASAVIAAVEAPKGGVTASSVSAAGTPPASTPSAQAETIPAVAIITATTSADVGSAAGISAIVKGTTSSPVVTNVPEPIVPATPVTSVLPTAGATATATELSKIQPTYK